MFKYDNNIKSTLISLEPNAQHWEVDAGHLNKEKNWLL